MKKKRKMNSRVMNTNEWKNAMDIYENFNMDINTPPMLRFGEPLTEEEISQIYKEILDTCDYFYPAYLDLGIRKLNHAYEPAKKLLDKGFGLFIQIEPKKRIQEMFNIIVDNLEKFWRWDLITEYAEELIKLQPRNADFFDTAAFSYGQLGSEKKAIELGQKAIELAPWSQYYTNNLGWIYLIFNHKDRAREMFEKSLEIDPDYTFAENNLQDCLNMQKNNLSFIQAYLTLPDKDTIDKHAERDNWETVYRIVDELTSQYQYVFQMFSAREHIGKYNEHPNLFSTLNPFFSFVKKIDNGYHINEDISFMEKYFKEIMHKFIFKHKDVDDEILQEIFDGILIYYDFLCKHKLFREEQFFSFKDLVNGMRDEMFTKMHRYNEVRHNDAYSEREKQKVRKEVFGYDHTHPFL
jgi:tetratricopeptide (TPR) repeat protein